MKTKTNVIKAVELPTKGLDQAKSSLRQFGYAEATSQISTRALALELSKYGFTAFHFDPANSSAAANLEILTTAVAEGVRDAQEAKATGKELAERKAQWVLYFTPKKAYMEANKALPENQQKERTAIRNGRRACVTPVVNRVLKALTDLEAETKLQNMDEKERKAHEAKQARDKKKASKERQLTAAAKCTVHELAAALGKAVAEAKTIKAAKDVKHGEIVEATRHLLVLLGLKAVRAKDAALDVTDDDSDSE